MEAITTSLASSLEPASEVVIRERASVQFAIYTPAVDGSPLLTEAEFVELNPFISVANTIQINLATRFNKCFLIASFFFATKKSSRKSTTAET